MGTIEDITLSEKSRSHSEAVPRVVKFTGAESGGVTARGRGGRGGGVLSFNGSTVGEKSSRG